VLWPSAGVQKVVAGVVLGLQLLRMMLGGAGLATLAAIPLAFSLLDDRTAGVMMKGLGKVIDQQLEGVKQLLIQQGLLKESAGGLTQPVDAASAELLAYKPKGGRQRRFSNDSLASMMTGASSREQQHPVGFMYLP
jgi:hypothetical protein